MARLRELWSNLSPKGRRGVVGGAVAAVVLVVLGTALALGGDSGDEAATTTRRTTTSSTTTSVVVTTTTEPKTGPRAPLTGLKVGDTKLLFRPPLAVKIDNLDAPRESALPQAGLPFADVVVEEIVEGNITRFVAVFHSHTPEGRVGPVRSARTTDLEILPQLAPKTLLAWSGANGGVTAAVRNNPFVIDVGYDVATGSYHRDRGRRAPHNLFVNAAELWKHGEGERFPNTMFHYRKPGEKAPSGAPKSQGVDIDWRGVASAPVSWRWDPKARVYVRFQRGRPHKDETGAYITTKNVVVQVTDYGLDGSKSPVAHTTGSGEVFVYTNGREIQGTWTRPYPDFPAALRDEAGKPIKLSPGPTWIELAKPGMAKTIGG